MTQRKDIHMDLIELVGGERVLRLSDAGSGLSLEKMLDPKQPVARQEERVVGVFEAALARAEVTAA